MCDYDGIMDRELLNYQNQMSKYDELREYQNMMAEPDENEGLVYCPGECGEYVHEDGLIHTHFTYPNGEVYDRWECPECHAISLDDLQIETKKANETHTNNSTK